MFKKVGFFIFRVLFIIEKKTYRTNGQLVAIKVSLFTIFFILLYYSYYNSVKNNFKNLNIS